MEKQIYVKAMNLHEGSFSYPFEKVHFLMLLNVSV